MRLSIEKLLEAIDVPLPRAAGALLEDAMQKAYGEEISTVFDEDVLHCELEYEEQYWDSVWEFITGYYTEKGSSWRMDPPEEGLPCSDEEAEFVRRAALAAHVFDDSVYALAASAFEHRRLHS